MIKRPKIVQIWFHEAVSAFDEISFQVPTPLLDYEISQIHWPLKIIQENNNNKKKTLVIIIALYYLQLLCLCMQVTPWCSAICFSCMPHIVPQRTKKYIYSCQWGRTPTPCLVYPHPFNWNFLTHPFYNSSHICSTTSGTYSPVFFWTQILSIIFHHSQVGELIVSKLVLSLMWYIISG